MLGFFIKKSFFDGWDNLFGLAAFNVVHLLLSLVFIALPLSLGAGDVLVTRPSRPRHHRHVGLAVPHDLRDERTPPITSRWGSNPRFAFIGAAWKPGLIVGLFNVALCFSFTIGIPFYLAQKSFLGLFLASLLFWTCLVAVLASQYYLPLEARRGGGFKKNAKVAMMLLIDNLGFSLFLFVYNVITLILSVFTALMAPGLAGIAMACCDAVKLRLKKYEWLEKNPGADRKHVPWTELLEEEKELVGVRTLKGMIFPWKEGK